MLYFITGIFSGFLGGMGIGGGTILIPTLVFFLHINQKIAQSINLLSFIPLSIVAIITHLKNKNINIKIALYLIIPGLIGALLGSTLAISLSTNYLKKIFSIFLFIMGFYQLFCKEKE
ncbi:sulfite exporter TauE/SafE family protein [Garciella nitratireducens]|uniref:Probable membrane transporter protein n=1 Tax=Garciella nitratireducens DSM 15102 TaxID=1121911 RepID=A0A1T4K203_9FIRM|nr:sulfite exporter TauE/SafE family protein [Garciella nitratireducens]RBP46620.1 hypothetical protein DFR81_10111 [Garciella nitratireducens]SJZ36413.1 hypothetical protein SAMN02745973_00289 [Garciella nitratireducens DSM 15102]